VWGAAGVSDAASILVPAGGASTATFGNGITNPPGTWYSTGLATISGATPGSVATVQLRVWYNDGGLITSYDAAMAAGVPAGFSPTANVTVGGTSSSGPPDSPTDVTCVIGSFSFGTTPSFKPPVIGSLSLSGPNLLLNGTNYYSGFPYYVLTSTNLSLPLSQWVPIATNSNLNGSFTIPVPNTVNLDVPQQFYILRTAKP
jgi:hypothetical protein